MSQYRTGTVTVTAGSNVVTGSGTSWVGNVFAGSVFAVQGSGVPYVVAADAVANGTLQLTSNYAGSTAAGQLYSVTTSFTPNLELPYPEAGDIDTAAVLKRAMLMIDTYLTGTLGAVMGGVLFGSNGAIGSDPTNFWWDDVDNYLRISGALTGSPFFAPTAGQGILFGAAVNGLSLTGRGSTYDVSLVNLAGSVALGITTGTTGLVAPGALTVQGTLTTAATVVSTSASAALYNTGTTATLSFAGAAQNISISGSFSGAQRTLTLANSANTAGSDSRIYIEVGGTSAGDPFMVFRVPGGNAWYMALDNSASDVFIIGLGELVATTPAITITTARNTTFGGSITTSVPSGGTAAAWKLGSLISVGSPNVALDLARYVEVDIGGVAVKLAVVK